jgi:poly(hydroxyalkanoate) depolymerase family esterase
MQTVAVDVSAKGLGTPLPLVVALHGCDESAAHFAYVSQLNWLADTERFIVAWPEQTAVANTLLCWNWFLTAHQQRDTGEAAIIAGITRSVAQEFPVQPDRIHAVGISAGGAMALVEGVVFPDLYASVATVAGCPFQGTPCLGAPSSLSGDALASLAFQAMGAHARALPVFVMQGDADFNVTPANGELIVQQFLGVADRADDGASNDSVSRQPAQSSSGSVPGGHDYDIDVYEDAEAHPIVERWLVHGMGHAWSGGAVAITYSDPAGPDASFESYRFFKQHPMP